MKARAFLLLLLCLIGARAEERQRHGVLFEKWIRGTFFGGYTPSGYTQKWDIPAEANERHGRVPVNPKAAKYGGSVDLGDALRQFDIEEPFLLVIGFWESEGAGRRMVNLCAIRVEPDAWRALWGALTRGDLERLDALIKDRSRSPDEARKAAQALKRRPPYRDALMTLNPKIDERGQRRLQCSLRFDVIFERLAPGANRARQEKPSLWGAPWPGFDNRP